MNAASEFDIAIVGMSGRFPGAPTLHQFWQNLSDGVESITRFSDEELLAAGVPACWLDDPRYVNAAPILEDPGAFDAKFFRFSPEEARTLDPQHRILLELAYEALEDAGYDPDRYSGRIGVFTGAALNTYFLNGGLEGRLAEEYIPTLIGADKDFLSTRIAYKLNLRGPSITVQTACSTSMVAVHLARQSLLSHETDMVLAGGISVRVPHRAGYFYDGGGVVSPDGRVRAFDAAANGTVFGSGGGVLVLKRLVDAVSDGDNIYAVIKGSAVNNDGSAKAGYTAPSVNGQAEAVIEAVANAAVEADTITYIEAHGSGTPVGDPVEIRALTKAFRTFTQRCGFCAIGSVKTNVGHLDAAAAVAGIIKTVLALKNRKIPPSLHFSQPNSEIDFAETPFYVNSKLQEWTSNGPRRAGVMSTGMGGTNAHLVLEEAPETENEDRTGKPQLFVLSANTESALDQVAHRLQAFLERSPSVNIADVAYTLQVGHKTFPYRRYTVGASREDVIASLGPSNSREIFSDGADVSSHHPVILLLPGVGDHYVGMAHELYQEWETFRSEVDRCAEVLVPYLNADVRKILYPESQGWKKENSSKGIDLRKLLGRGSAEENDIDAANLNRTRFVQPALFTIEYALARLWASLGVTPDAIVGHSMGEYVAACLAGVFSLEDALRVIATRAKLVDGLPQGRMLAVMLPEQELLPLLGRDLSIALINGPDLCVVAGPAIQTDELEDGLQRKGVVCRHVQNGHAFHSRMMNPVVDAFELEVRKVRLNEPRIPFISNVTGNWITRTQATDPAYWAKHVNHPARFNDALHQLWKVKDATLLEAGPGRTLSVLAMQHPDQRNASHPVTVSSLRHSYENRSDAELLWRSIGKLWVSGAAIRWDNIARSGRRRISLPTYPFERKNYWHAADSATRLQGRNRVRASSNLDNWFYAPTWERATPLDQGGDTERLPDTYWLIFADREGEGACIQAKLDELRLPAGLVRFGERFIQRKDDTFELNPESREDYLELLRELQARAPRGLNIIHLGGFTRDGRPTNSSLAASSQTFGFFSMLYLSQAIAELGISIPINIGIVSSRLHQVTGEETLDPTMATVLGPCGVIPKEFSNVNCFNIDLPADRSIDRLPSAVVGAILSEFSNNSRGRIVAYRGKYRWERVYRQVELPKAPSSKISRTETTSRGLRREGVYLITGGTGGIGLALAQHLAETCKARLVLTKKAQFPEKARWKELQKTRELAGPVQKTLEKLLEIQDLGAEVEVVSAEASDRAQMKAALDYTVKRFGTIHGVFHAAGILRAGLMAANNGTAEKVLAPKVYGTMILGELLREVKNTDLDFLVLFSSMASITTPYAHCDYSAANSFLDAFAGFSNTQNRFHTLTVNWPLWKEVGRVAEMEALLGAERWKEISENAISTSDGLRVLRRALNSGLSRLIVSPDNLENVLRESESMEFSWSERLFDPATCPVPSEDDVKASLPAATQGAVGLPGNEIEAKLVEIWSGAFGLEPIGVHDNFFEIGGHSLLAARIVSQVERAFGKRLPMTSIFRAPTIAQLAATLQGAPAPH
jgi:acyl transferase domain-containing protein/acyl carrier protein